VTAAASAPLVWTAAVTAAASAPLVWTADIKLFSAAMLRQWTVAILATGLIMALLLGTIAASDGDWEAVPSFLLIAAGAAAGLWLLGLVIMAVLFRGRMRVRYTLSDEGLLQETVDSVAKGANRAALVAGVLTGKPGLAGSGLIGRSRESESVSWSGAFKAVPQPARRMIALRNSWRTLMFVQCTPENYDAVLARVNAAIASHGAEGRVKRGSPLPFFILHGLLILLASAPLFGLCDAFDLDIFAPILILCFAEATLWLIPLFGWVVIAGLGYLAFMTAADLAEVRQSMFSPGETYTGFDVLDGEETTVLLLAGLGAAYLVWLSLRAIRGRIVPLLVQDQSDMDGG